MNFHIAKTMQRFPNSIFGDLKAATIEAANNGQQIIDLSLGSPDMPPHEKIRHVLSEEAKKASSYGYTLTGTQNFYEAVARYYKRRSNVTLHAATDIIQTIGSQEGLVHLPVAFCDPGDIVLTTNPAYVAYDAGISLAGATSYYMPLEKEYDYLPNLAAIPEDVAKKARLLILNLPGNPVPAMPTESYFAEVVAFAKKYNIIVLHDAAYSEFYFEGDKPLSFLATPGAMDVGLEINSLSKSFSLAGTRIAYIAGNPDMIAVLKQLKSNLDFGIFEAIQTAAVTALDMAEEITDTLRTTFASRHRTLMTGLEELGWDVAPSNGGMFVWAKYPYHLNSEEMAFTLIREAGVVTVPGTAFGTAGEGYLRLALVQPEATLQRAVERLRDVTITA